jgi:PiT family inorganic phosphate transporter
MTLAVFSLVLALAYANGSNDVSKGVATVVGSGLAGYRRALAWGTLWTFAGATAALAVSAGLVKTFSTALVGAGLPDAPEFPLAVAAGATGWVLLASRTGLPVSTTHALAGAIVGVALAAAGPAGIHWPLLAATVVVPLAVSPIAAAALAYAGHAAGARMFDRACGYCVCADNGLRIVPAAAGAAAVAAPVPIVTAGAVTECAEAGYARQLTLADAAHWTTSAALSFARGLNDTPKIIAPAAMAATAAGLGGPTLLLAGAAAMAAGSYIFGRRVTRTLATKITDIDPWEGLAASGVSAGLVLAASFVALPVSTTHVSTGAIVGAGLRSGGLAIEWRTIGRLAAAWLITLPVAALLSAAVWVVASGY